MAAEPRRLRKGRADANAAAAALEVLGLDSTDGLHKMSGGDFGGIATEEERKPEEKQKTSPYRQSNGEEGRWGARG